MTALSVIIAWPAVAIIGGLTLGRWQHGVASTDWRDDVEAERAGVFYLPPQMQDRAQQRRGEVGSVVGVRHVGKGQ